MIVRKLLAALLMLTLIAGYPMAATICVGAGCGMSGVAAEVRDSYGGADMASCALACSAVPAAVGDARAKVLPLDAGSPLDSAAWTTRSFSRPPDTAPPKVLSA